jgi:hypothetical protein
MVGAAATGGAVTTRGDMTTGGDMMTGGAVTTGGIVTKVVGGAVAVAGAATPAALVEGWLLTRTTITPTMRSAAAMNPSNVATKAGSFARAKVTSRLELGAPTDQGVTDESCGCIDVRTGRIDDIGGTMACVSGRIGCIDEALDIGGGGAISAVAGIARNGSIGGGCHASG